MTKGLMTAKERKAMAKQLKRDELEAAIWDLEEAYDTLKRFGVGEETFTMKAVAQAVRIYKKELERRH